MGLSRAAEDRPTPSEVYNYRIYLLTFLACLGSWMFGYNNGVSNLNHFIPSFGRLLKLYYPFGSLCELECHRLKSFSITQC